MEIRVSVFRAFLVGFFVAALGPAGASAQSATQTITIIVGERHQLTIPGGDQVADDAGAHFKYLLRSSSAATKVTGAVLEKGLPVELSLQAPEIGFSRGLRMLDTVSHELVVGRFTGQVPTLELQYRGPKDVQRPVVRLTVTD